MPHELRRVEAEPNVLMRMVRAWERFFFAPADPTPWAAVRICGGLLILYVHLTYCFDLQTFFGRDAMIDLAMINDMRHDGPWQGMPLDWPSEFPEQAPNLSQEDLRYAHKWDVDPNRVVAKGSWKWSIWFHATDPTWMALIHGGVLLAMACLTIGFCTRVAAVLTWVSVLSYVNRSQPPLFGMDAIISIVSLYLAIGPSGAAWSVDRWLARRRARQTGDWTNPVLAEQPEPLVSANLVLRLCQIHLCIIYFASGISKLQGHTWWMGTAVWGTMANYEFSPMQSQVYLDFLRFVAGRRWLWELFMTGSTMFTLAFEIGFPFLIWLRSWRWVFVISAVFLHLGIAFFMGLVGFSTIMIVMVLAFIPAEAYHQGLERLRRLFLRSEGPSGTVQAAPRQDSRPTAVVRLSRSA